MKLDPGGLWEGLDPSRRSPAYEYWLAFEWFGMQLCAQAERRPGGRVHPAVERRLPCSSCFQGGRIGSRHPAELCVLELKRAIQPEASFVDIANNLSYLLLQRL